MFSVTEMQGFELFSAEHLVTLGIFIGVCLGLVLFRNQIRPHKNVLKMDHLLDLGGMSNLTPILAHPHRPMANQ